MFFTWHYRAALDFLKRSPRYTGVTSDQSLQEIRQTISSAERMIDHRRTYIRLQME